MSGPQGSDPTWTWVPGQGGGGADAPPPPGSEEQTAQTEVHRPAVAPAGQNGAAEAEGPTVQAPKFEQPQQPGQGYPPTVPPQAPSPAPPYTPSGTAPYQPPASDVRQPPPPAGPFGRPGQHGAPPDQYSRPPDFSHQPTQPGSPSPPPGPHPQPHPAQYGPPPGPYSPPARPQPAQYGPPPGQYSRPPDVGQQPPQYGQPGQYGQFQPHMGRPIRQGRKWILIGAGVAALIVAAVLILGFWAPGFFMTKQLDVNKAQTGVQHILTDPTIGYGAKDVTDVKCNNGQDPVVKKGGTFNCDVTIGGTKRQVTVTFVDDNGTYQVSRPK